MTRRWMAGAALVAALAGPVAAAEPDEDRPITAAVARLDFEAVEPTPAAALNPAQRLPYQAQPQRSRKARVGRAIAGAAIGAVGGAFAGGYLGASLEPDCNCDDPGFKGFLIGFPTGGIVGGVLGGMFLFR
jgi:hypothetical protein